MPVLAGGKPMGTAVSQLHRSPRYPLHADLEIRGDRGIIPAFVTDVSRDGMFVATRERFAVGQSFEGRLRLARPLTLNCIVARVVPGRGIGVRFVVV